MTGEIDINQLLTSMNRIHLETNVEVGAIMRDVAALTVADLIKSTPPIELSDGRRGSDAAAFKLGKQAMARDISAIVYGVTAWSKAYLGHTPNLKNGTSMFKGKTGAVFIAGDDMVDPDGSKIGAWHKSKRDARGRVTASTRKTLSTTSRDGRFDRVYRIVTPIEKLKAYIAEKQARIGATRAGWLAAWNHFKAFALTTTYAAPDWVTRHGDKDGAFTDSGDYASLSCDLTATNRVPWIQQTRIAEVINSVLRTREVDFARGKYEMRLQKVLDRQRPAGVAA